MGLFYLLLILGVLKFHLFNNLELFYVKRFNVVFLSSMFTLLTFWRRNYFFKF